MTGVNRNKVKEMTYASQTFKIQDTEFGVPGGVNWLYRRAKLWNVLAYYDQNGNPLDAGTFCEGDGIVNVYSSTGKIIKIKIYRKGKVKSSRFVDRNGSK